MANALSPPLTAFRLAALVGRLLIFQKGQEKRNCRGKIKEPMSFLIVFNSFIGLAFIKVQIKVTTLKSNNFLFFLQFYVAMSHFFALLHAPMKRIPFYVNSNHNANNITPRPVNCILK